MTTVDLKAVFFNLAADLSNFQAFNAPSGLTVSTGVDADVRTLANGRTRIVRRAGTPRTFAVTLEYLQRPQLAWIESHVGELMCVRDHLGRKMYGAYFEAAVQELAYITDRGDAGTLTFREVSHSEAV